MPRALPILTVALAVAMAGGAQADPQAGKGLAEQWCVECHAVAGTGASANPKAPPFRDIAAMPSTTEYALRAFLRSPHPTMPNLVVQPNDANDIIGYILSLAPQK